MGVLRLQLASQAQHVVEDRSRFWPAAVGHGQGADARSDAQGDLRQLHPGAGCGHHGVTAQGQFQAPAEGHAVDGGNYGLLHGIQVHQKPRAIAGEAGGSLGITEQLREAPDVGAGAEGTGAVTGDDKAEYILVIFTLADDVQELVGDGVVEGVHGLGATQGDDHHTIDLVHQQEATEVQVLGQRPSGHGHARAFGGEAFQDALHFLSAEFVHQLQRPLLESQGQDAAEVQVLWRAYPAVEDVHGLGDEDAEHAVADGGGQFVFDFDGLARSQRVPGLGGAEDVGGAVVLALLFHL